MPLKNELRRSFFNRLLSLSMSDESIPWDKDTNLLAQTRKFQFFQSLVVVLCKQGEQSSSGCLPCGTVSEITCNNLRVKPPCYDIDGANYFRVKNHSCISVESRLNAVIPEKTSRDFPENHYTFSKNHYTFFENDYTFFRNFLLISFSHTYNMRARTRGHHNNDE